MEFQRLAEYMGILDGTASRNSMTEILAELMKELEPFEVEEFSYMVLGQLGPSYEQIQFNLAEKMVMRAIALANKQPIDKVRELYKKVGDMGDVATELATHNEEGFHSALTIKEVYQKLTTIASEGGAGSQEKKVNGLAELLGSLSPLSQKYVVRLILSKLRLGFSDKTMLDAWAVADQGSKLGRKKLEEAYQLFPDIGKIGRLVKETGIENVNQKVTVTLGVPLIPALAQRLKTAEEMIEKMGNVVVEPKYDGTRVQIHVNKEGEKWKIKTFTRNLEETTPMFPELTAALEQIKATKVILDSEAVGIDPRTGKMLAFQATITRKRKHGIEEAQRTVPLQFFVFDLLYIDGVSLVNVPLSLRKEKLSAIITPGKVLKVSQSITTNDAGDLRAYHAQQLKDGLEGVVVKQVNSIYEPGRRGWSWVKFKEVEEAFGKLSDTIDGVVMGFYQGKGKRTAFGIGAFLIGVRDETNEEIKTIAKIGTGLSDEQWRELRKRLEQNVAMSKPNGYKVDKQLEPDVWVDPTIVVEVAADEITKSPVHSAGVALRFPRLVRFRDDKNVAQATSITELDKIK